MVNWILGNNINWTVTIFTQKIIMGDICAEFQEDVSNMREVIEQKCLLTETDMFSHQLWWDGLQLNCCHATEQCVHIFVCYLTDWGRDKMAVIFQTSFSKTFSWMKILIKISVKFVPKDQINNIPTLVQIMAWRRPGNKPLSELMMVRLLMHICVTWPQWVNSFGGPFDSYMQQPLLLTMACCLLGAKP